jgi:hypothetical protein
MTTGTVINALAHCEAHLAIVSKARSLAVKDPVFRSPHEIVDEMNAMLVSAALLAKPLLHHVLAHDVQDILNQV